MSSEDIDPRYHATDTYRGKYPPDWDARRRVVYRRDGYTCKECGVRSGPYGNKNSPALHAHHVKPLSESGTNHLRNLVTLCDDCHNDIHEHDIFDGRETPDAATSPKVHRRDKRDEEQRPLSVVKRGILAVLLAVSVFFYYVLSLFASAAIGGPWILVWFVGWLVLHAVMFAHRPLAGVVLIGLLATVFGSVAEFGLDYTLLRTVVILLVLISGPCIGCCWSLVRSRYGE